MITTATFIVGCSVSAAIGTIIGIWLTVRGTFGKIDDLLPPPQQNVVDELAPSTPPGATTEYRALSKPESGTPAIDLATIVPQFGMPELRTNYEGHRCMRDGAEVRRDEQFVFVPISNGSPGSGLVICQHHAAEVIPDAARLDDPADV